MRIRGFRWLLLVPALPLALNACAEGEPTAASRGVVPAVQVAAVVPATATQKGLKSKAEIRLEQAHRYSRAMKWSRNEVSRAQAFNEFKRLAHEGYPRAMATLGISYEKQLGTTYDIHAAKYWYQQAADHGEPQGNWYLYKIYMAGNTGPRSVEKACMELRTALQRGFYRVTDTYNQFCGISG